MADTASGESPQMLSDNGFQIGLRCSFGAPLAISLRPLEKVESETVTSYSQDQSPPHPDAALIAACRHFEAARAACNEAAGTPDYDRLWQAYENAAWEVTERAPVTIVGLAAKARAAKAEARSPDGSEELELMSAEWAMDLLNDVIRIAGEVA